MTTILQSTTREPDISQSTFACTEKPVRVLYSFPYKIGATRICWTAWQQVLGITQAGAEVIVLSGASARPFPFRIKLQTTLTIGSFGIPGRLLNRMLRCRLHDWRTASWLNSNAVSIDIVHAWPMSSLRTIRTAHRLGIPVVLERPNTHTRHAYSVVAEEGRKVGISLPRGHDHAFNASTLKREEAEYNECDFLLCPSDYVASTFRAEGFAASKLIRHQYGFDEGLCRPGEQQKNQDPGLVVIYAGVCEPRKGLHYALEAWLASGAQERGTFIICGNFVRGYYERLATMLSHPSIKVLGHRNDLPDLMRGSDIFVLPSIEEGSALVTYEARGCGCVLAVSDASGAVCRHLENGFVHSMRDVKALTDHIAQADSDRKFLGELRARSLATVSELTWKAAGTKLVSAYREVVHTRKTRL